MKNWSVNDGKQFIGGQHKWEFVKPSAPAIRHDSGGCPTGGYPTGGYPTGEYPTGGYPNGGYPNGGYPIGYFIQVMLHEVML